MVRIVDRLRIGAEIRFIAHGYTGVADEVIDNSSGDANDQKKCCYCDKGAVVALDAEVS